ncbi:hypothetical protein [Microbulbifer yueqingensis]|uniref:hypothetical protein n=1 Tax=Microbulbifer yueqingensis TaxID=658219 RepID=UPI000B80E1DC|nr:hypothetical protein [Microbulbifer yueqingensis]
MEISVLYSVALSLVLLLLLKFFIVRGDLVIAAGILALMVVRWLHLDRFDARYLPLVTAHHR